jgi:hypothetical protein
MTEIRHNVRLVPLYEDLTKIIGTELFVSTVFKRWLVKVGMAEIRDKGNKLDTLEENVTYANTDENDDKNKYLFRRRKSTIFRE